MVLIMMIVNHNDNANDEHRHHHRHRHPPHHHHHHQQQQQQQPGNLFYLLSCAYVCPSAASSCQFVLDVQCGCSYKTLKSRILCKSKAMAVASRPFLDSPVSEFTIPLWLDQDLALRKRLACTTANRRASEAFPLGSNQLSRKIQRNDALSARLHLHVKSSHLICHHDMAADDDGWKTWQSTHVHQMRRERGAFAKKTFQSTK